MTEDQLAVDFSLPEALDDFMPWLSWCAADIHAVDSGRLDAAVLRNGVSRVGALQAGAVLAELDPPDAAALLFHAGSVLGAANLPVAWQGLAGAAGSLLGVPGEPLVAVLTSTGPRVWVPVLPEREAVGAIWCPAGTSQAVMHGSRAVPVRSDRGLVGLPAGGQLDLVPNGPVPDGDGLVSLGAWARCHAATSTLLLGLLDGACQRLTREAFQYARQDRAPAPPLANYQAVAVRLGEVAVRQAALNVTLRLAAETPGSLRVPVEQVAQWATELARECLQVAAAHGYVAGLPFRRLVEQVNTVLGALAGHLQEYHRCVALDRAAGGTGRQGNRPWPARTRRSC